MKPLPGISAAVFSALSLIHAAVAVIADVAAHLRHVGVEVCASAAASRAARVASGSVSPPASINASRLSVTLFHMIGFPDHIGQFMLEFRSEGAPGSGGLRGP